MKITVTGHSLINPRQHMLFSYMAATDLAEVQVISPSRWFDEKCKTTHQHGYQHECLDVIGQSILSYKLRGLEDCIQEFNPDILYVMEEPYTPFARYCSKISRRQNIPMAVFTWENVLDRRFGVHYDSIEKEVITSASVLVAGTAGAKKRLIHSGAAEDKIAICPQTGIATEFFKPMPNVEKTYDVAYFGRMVKEKGIEYIESVAKDLNLKMLWVGGRGDITPSYGDYVPWVDYLKMPEYYNKTKLFVTYPNSFNGFYEQLNYSIPEAMACGTPVVSSDNGSIAEVYKAAPIVFAEEANEEALCDSIKYTFDNPIQRTVPEKRAEEGIQWVHENLGIDVVADRLFKILKAV